MKRGIPPGFSNRIGTGRGVRGVRSFSSGFGEAKRRRQEAPSEDTDCRKKLKFAHVHEKDIFGCMPDDSPTHKEESTVQKSGGPKTSKYAFFQKIKEGLPQRLQSNPSYLKKSQSEGVPNSDKDADSSMLDEDVMPMNFHTFFSPAETKPKKHVTAADQELSDVFTEEENLHQWMRNASSHEANELYSKGTCHIDRADKFSPNWNLKPLSFKADTDREFQENPPKPMEILDGSCWGYDLPSSWSSKSTKRIFQTSDFSWRESEEIGFSPRKNGPIPSYARERVFSTMESPVRESEEADFMLGNIRPILPNPNFDGSDSFSCPSDLDGFPGSVLQWNFDSAKHERDFMTSPNKEPNHDSRLLNFWHNDHHQQRNGIGDLGLGLDALRLTSDCSEEFFNRNSNSHRRHCDEPYFHPDSNGDSVTSVNHLYMSISCSGSYYNLLEHGTEEIDRRENYRVLQLQYSPSESSSIW